MASLEGKISKKFPHRFLWGSATSAYQVEGGNTGSDWESFGKLRINFPVAGRACDHYNRYEGDFDIAASLNQNAHRLSIEWARIEPERGKFNEREVEHYREVLKALRKRNIKPLVTLHHFTNPLWVAKRGGWENHDVVSYFESYVRFIVTQLKDLCDFWITVNEPAVYTVEGYLFGSWPPRARDPLKAFIVARHMLKAHRAAYRIIHDIQPKACVGIAYVLGYFRSFVPFDPLRYWERMFIKEAKVQDFIGVNYYRATGWTQDLLKNDIGWSIFAEGLYENLVELENQFGLPIYITENGIADIERR